jgi:hypothetical protein
MFAYLGMPHFPDDLFRELEMSDETNVGRGAMPQGLIARIAAVSAILLVIGGFLDAVIAIVTKTETLTCSFGIHFPWCPPSPAAHSSDRDGEKHEATGLGPAGLDSPATRVNSFAIQVFNTMGAPPANMDSGRRDWKRVTPDRWIEVYPNGTTVYLDVLGRGTLEDCPGTIVRGEVDRAHRAFIPDKGCPGMPFFISDSGQNWGIASPMREVQ